MSCPAGRLFRRTTSRWTESSLGEQKVPFPPSESKELACHLRYSPFVSSPSSLATAHVTLLFDLNLLVS
jgi:hypothetical protein